MTSRIKTLKNRADFLRARKGRYFATPGLILQASKVIGVGEMTGESGAVVENASTHPPLNKPSRFGFTATKKLGNAVVRNRVKRRLREAVLLIAPQEARPDTEYVLIGRKSTLKRPFSSLLQDLTIAFAKVHGKRVHKKKRGVSKGENAKGGDFKNTDFAQSRRAVPKNTR